jgi:hypothetical protein
MLEELAGHWEGDGKTSDEAPFTGVLNLDPLAGGSGFAVAFQGVAKDGSVLFRHRGILAGDRLAFLDDSIGELKILDRRGDHVFGSGDPTADESYRLEISFDVAGPGEMDLTITSGLPGEPFTARLHAHLVRGTPPE